MVVTGGICVEGGIGGAAAAAGDVESAGGAAAEGVGVDSMTEMSGICAGAGRISVPDGGALMIRTCSKGSAASGVVFGVA